MAEYREYFHCLESWLDCGQGKGRFGKYSFFDTIKKEDFLKALSELHPASNFAVIITRPEAL